jgi:hypothetical protein
MSYLSIKRLGDFGTSYQDLQSLASQVQQAANSASSNPAVQAIMARATPFNTPGFKTVGDLANKLMSFNPPSNFYDQDAQVLNQALSDIMPLVQRHRLRHLRRCHQQWDQEQPQYR